MLASFGKRRAWGRERLWLLSCVLGLVSGQALGLGLHDFKPFEALPTATRKLTLQRFGQDALKLPGFGLLGTGTGTLDDAMRRLLQDHAVPFGYEVRSSGGFSLVQGSESRDYRFYVRGIPVCGMTIRAHRSAKGSTLILGKSPTVAPHAISLQDWPDLELAFRQIAGEIEARGLNGNETRLTKASRCLWPADGGLLPVWEMTVRSGGLPYRGIADGYELLQFEHAYFAADGLARVYPHNDLDGDLVDIILTDLKGDGTLTSTYLKLIPNTENNKSATPVKKDDHQFIYDPIEEALAFTQVSAYAHAQTHFKFFLDIGFEWYGPAPLEVKIHERPHGQVNNALFIPGDANGTSLPTIYIGDGDGKALQNLPRDADVVSHEFGHHVIYKHLQSTSGESLVLHEGLADFFAFSRTGNACLGESICPEKSYACWEEAKCLRTGETTMKYNDTLYKKLQGHHQGQVVSGMLWDLYVKDLIPMEELTRLAFRAVNLLVSDSGFEHWILALFHADQELFDSKYYDALKTAATDRGFDLYLSVVPDKGAEVPKPEDVPETLNPLGPSQGGGKEKKETSKSETIFDKCGVVSDKAPYAALPLLLLLALPLIAPAFATARVRSRRR